MKSLSILSLLLFLVPGANAQTINVAVVEAASGGNGGGAAVVTQLNDDTYFDFTATLVDPAGVDSAAELADYDAVVLGGSGQGTDPIWSVAMANALKNFVEGGGGLLMTGWGHWNSFSAGPANALPAAILDTVVPGDIDNSYSFITYCCAPGTTIVLTDLSHPITQDLPASISYGAGSYVEYNSHLLQPGDVSLGIPSGLTSSQSGHALIYRENIGAGNGRSVYLGALHFAAVNANRSTQSALRSGPGDQLLEQTVAWLASYENADADGDGVLDADDFCPGTVIPEGVPTVKLNPNHWALIDEGFEFDTLVKGKGKGPNRSYLTEDTAGCSCEQIIDAQGLGYGLTKHGCSIGVMDDWVELVTP